MKRKMSIGMAFALAMALVVSSVAVAAGMNLFELYSGEDERLAGLAGAAVLESVRSTIVETDELGRTAATITNAYYDGRSLIVGYSMENHMTMTEYTPAEAELETKTLIEEEPGLALRIRIGDPTEAVAAAIEAFEEMCRTGEACGVAFHTVEAAPYALTEEDVLIPGSSEWDNLSDGGDMRFFLRDFEAPVPEAAQNLDSLTVRIQLRRRTSFYWFDGERMYYLAGRSEDAGEMSAVVRRSADAENGYAGEVKLSGVQVKAEAALTPAFGRLVLTAEERVFDRQNPMDDEARSEAFRPFVKDEEGRWLDVSVSRLSEDLLSWEIIFYGNGEDELPEKLTVCLASEDDLPENWSLETVCEKAITIELNKIG